MMHKTPLTRAAVLSVGLSLAFGAAGTATAQTLVQGYERGANLAGQLGSDFLFDEAATGGGDATLGAAPASFGWVAQYNDLWDPGTAVSITGLAIPLQSNTNNAPNTTQNGDFTFTFFDLNGGPRPNAFDGFDFSTMTGAESVLGSVTATFDSFGAGGAVNTTDEYFFQFDSPLDFTSASSGLAFHVQSTNTARLKIATPGATRRAERVTLAAGEAVAGANSSFAATLAGTPVAFPPPPPPSLAFRMDAGQAQVEGNRVWESIEPSLEQFGFNIPQAGDYNGDGLTNAADYTVYRDNVGSDDALFFTPGSRDPGNAGVINATDRDFWAANYGEPAPVAVNDPSVPGITAAYTQGSTGQANVFENGIGGLQASRQNASFEVWMKPDDLAGGDQIIFEVGGTGTGSYLSLQGDQLSFFVNGQFDGNEQTLTTTLADADWTQVAVVINNTFSSADASSDDFVDLYVDGVLAASTSGATTDINRWAGGNQAGLGQEGGNFAGGGPISAFDDPAQIDFAFDGQIAIFEYAPATAWDATEVLTRFNAITGASANAVPEPGAALLLSVGVALAAASRRRSA